MKPCSKIKCVLVLLAFAVTLTDGETRCEELNGEKTISLTLATQLKLSLDLPSNDKTSHHLDLVTGGGDVALRVSTKRLDPATIEVKVLSLKSTSFGMITVGRHGQGVVEAQGQVNMTITIDQEQFNVMCGGRVLSKEHSFPFQTVHFIHTQLTVTVCNKPDACDSVCLTCPPGTHLTPSSNLSSHLSYNHTHACAQCEDGTFTSTLNEGFCEQCDVGHYSDSSTGKARCVPCPRGKFANNKGSNRCSQCPARTYSDKMGSHSCKICPAGTETEVAGPGSRACTTCKAGYFSRPQTSCRQCPQGSIAPTPGSSRCTPCSHSALSTTECTCPVGYILSDNTQCLLCPEGTVAEGMQCVECRGIVVEGRCEPKECTPGTKTASPGCEECPSGTFSASVNAVQCSVCAKGHYQPNTGQGKCLPCPAGSIQGVEGSSACTACPRRSYQPSEGALACLECTGTVRDNNCYKGNGLECERDEVVLASIGTFSWFSASVGQTVHHRCPLGGGQATRQCHSTGWGPGYYAHCNSVMSADIEEVLQAEYTDPVSHSKAVLDVVKDKAQLLGVKDLVKLSQCLTQITVDKSSAAHVVETIAEVSNYKITLADSLDSHTKSKYIEMLEASLHHLSPSLQYLSNDNLEINLVKKSDKMLLSNQAVRLSKETAFSTVVYKNTKFFDQGNQTTISSNIFGVNSEVKVDVEMDFAVHVGGMHECRWYDTESYIWRKKGCSISVSSDNMVQCRCNHLTSFAIFTSIDPVPEMHLRAQSLLTTVLFSLSILGLAMTLAVYLPIRSLRSKVIVKVELQQIISLLLANILFLFLSKVPHQSAECPVLVFALQYLYLVTMAWSLAASWTFYGQIVQAMNTYGKNYKNSFIASFVCCWILPAVFPAFAYGYSMTHGMDYVSGIDGEYGCWIDEMWKTYTFIIPLLLIVALNFILGLRIVHVMLQAARRNENKIDIYKRQVKSIFSLMTLFGTSFLLALFTKGPQAVYIQYLFICLTCTQGFWIFIFFVPLRPDVHKEWQNCLSGNPGTPRSSRKTTTTTGFSSLRKISQFARPSVFRKESPERSSPLSTDKVVKPLQLGNVGESPVMGNVDRF